VLVPSDVRPESTCGQNSESAIGFHRHGDPTAKTVNAATPAVLAYSPVRQLLEMKRTSRLSCPLSPSARMDK